MLYIRRGPRLLFLRSDMIKEMKEYFIHGLQGESVKFNEGLEKATEDSTIFFLTDTNHTYTSIEDAKEIILVNEVASICLASIINSHVAEWIDRVDMGPACMVLRIMGDEKKIMEKLKIAYNGELVDWEEGIRKGEKGDTLLSLSKKPISDRLTQQDLLKLNILIPYPVSYIHKKLRREGILFITQSLESREWYDLRINIYDSTGRYQENYERLVFVLSQLEVGMILGETWTRDHALILYSVLAYQVRLFTLNTPEEIKKILMALEYDEEGKRLVDFDLYYRNKKISWVDIEKKKGRRNKIEECMLYRQEILNRLSDSAREKLKEMEMR